MSHHHCRARTTTSSAFFVGLAAALAGGTVGTLVGRAAKPLAVGAIKQGIAVRENVRARAAEVREDLDDLVARAEHEYREKGRGTSGGTRSAGA